MAPSSSVNSSKWQGRCWALVATAVDRQLLLVGRQTKRYLTVWEGDEDQSVTGDDTILRGGRFGWPQATTWEKTGVGAANACFPSAPALLPLDR